MQYLNSTGTFQVLKNEEGQYSLWPARKQIPKGWVATGFEGSAAECMAQVDSEWLDMRPISLQQRMDAS
jgi:MbtH protein